MFRFLKHMRVKFLVLASIIAVVLAAGGLLAYSYISDPIRKTVLTVDDTSVSLGYFAKRVGMSEYPPDDVLEQLVYEQVVKIVAPSYGISVDESEVDQALRMEAATVPGDTTGNATNVRMSQMTDAEFADWYSEQLAMTGFTDAEYRDIVRSDFLAMHLDQYLVSAVPVEGEQAHINVIVLSSLEDAEKARTRVVSGENFAAVARELSIDNQTKEGGGDLGWVPRDVTPFDVLVFGLTTGEVSQPVTMEGTSFGPGSYALFMVSEKESIRPIAESFRQILRARALNNWLKKEVPRHEVKTNLDDESRAWVSAQIERTQE